jgi:hypothetical protein
MDLFILSFMNGTPRYFDLCSVVQSDRLHIQIKLCDMLDVNGSSQFLIGKFVVDQEVRDVG